MARSIPRDLHEEEAPFEREQNKETLTWWSLGQCNNVGYTAGGRKLETLSMVPTLPFIDTDLGFKRCR